MSLFLFAAIGRAETVCAIIDNLRSKNEDLVDATCKKLGLERGSIILVKVELISPHIKTATESFFIIGISWAGPNDGYLILMNKDGNILHKKRVGRINQLTLKQLQVGGDDFLLVDSNYRSGTGTKLDQYNIFSINNQGFLKVWDGVSNERESPGLLAPEDNFDIKALVGFEDIDNDGNLELLYYKRIVKYRFNEEKNKFIAEPASQKTEIYKLKKGDTHRYIYEKVSDK